MDKLPKGWNYKRLDIISKVVSGYAFPSNDFSKEGVYKTIKITNVGVQEFIELVDDDRLPLKYDGKFSSFRINTNDLVIALTRSIINDGLKVAIVPKSYDNSLLNQRVAAIKSENNMNSFIYYFLTSSIAYNYIQEKSKSLNQPNLSINDLKAIQIPLPSLSEQTRIVSKLDALFARIDKSIALLEENIKHTKRLMASVLEETFGEFDMTIYKPMLDVCSIYNNTMTPKDGEIYNYVGLENIESISGKLVEFSPSKGETIKSSKVRFEVDAVLYGKLRPYLNKVWVASFDGIATTEILPFKPNKKELNPTFLSYFLRSSSFVTLVNGNTSGARMPRATTSFFKTIAKVPVPDIETQSNISKKLDFVSQKTNQIIVEQQSKLTYLKALKSSLLDRAFKGDL